MAGSKTRSMSIPAGATPGAAGEGNPYGIPDHRPSRPGSVIAAGVITMVCSTGVALFAGALAAFGALVSDRGRPLPVMEGASHRCTPKTQGAPAQ